MGTVLTSWSFMVQTMASYELPKEEGIVMTNDHHMQVRRPALTNTTVCHRLVNAFPVYLTRP